jgi:tRNA(His) 5'-end guanylyltransferase
MNDSLGDRMKNFENIESGKRFMPLVPICARLDGKCFSKLTKGVNLYNEEMKAIRIIKIDACSCCMFRSFSDGLVGSYYFCEKMRKDLTEFDHPCKKSLDKKRDFPFWCPLEILVEK